ncbi:energy-coupling factor transporter transmembrane component T [Arcobacter sp. CECT 9188]|uniref:energy-coupling factor transporter transmembrane component T n=1 Tax=Arcobacter sp. CECT 9188 TaxID=2044505 RepID=UPI000DEB2954|nr:energy-coupling factor transporter transmembrane component T [Arcobacter sp. CECT 9188]RBQ26246.1 cobalt ABC transporter permease [Arcobacter sp. CECT 9188]
MNFNPAISLILAFLYSLLLSFSNVEIYFLIPIIFLFFINFNNLFKILKKLFFLNIFIVVLSLFLYIETNFYEAINLFIRVNLIILFNLLLFFNSKGFDIIRGFYILKFPNKFVSTLYFTIKMIFELSLDIQNIKNSLITRNFKAKTNMFTYKTFGNIFGLLFVKSISRAMNLKSTFELRHFKGDIFLSDDFIVCKYDIILIFFISITLILKVFI